MPESNRLQRTKQAVMRSGEYPAPWGEDVYLDIVSQLAALALALANALVLRSQGLVNVALPQLLCLKLIEPAPGGDPSQVDAFADRHTHSQTESRHTPIQFDAVAPAGHSAT